MLKIALLFCFIGISAALPAEKIISKQGSDLRYQYARNSRGEVHLADMWMTADVNNARYNPSTANVYHLFTRNNPSVSQPLVLNNLNALQQSNYDSSKRTIVLIHGWMDSAVSNFNTVLVPAFLAAEDVNVIVVDWSAGSSSLLYRVVIANAISSGIAVAGFIDWVNSVTGSAPVQYHIVGHGFGGHQAGIVGRNVQGDISYITGLDPALIGWVNHLDRFNPNDGLYTEVIHTNYGINGYLGDLAQVDFYPNGGISMPGCDTNACSHERSFHYFAESLISGGFTGRQCLNYYAAILGMCENLPGRLEMGGLRPKNGRSGVFILETNAAPPFSQG